MPCSNRRTACSVAGNPDDPDLTLCIKTRSCIPFVISVDYFWEREAEIGGGGTRQFLCFFGSIIELGESHEFAT